MGKSEDRVIDTVMALQIPDRQQPRTQRHSLAIVKLRTVDKVRNDARAIAVQCEDISQIGGGDDDFVDQSQKRRDRSTPPCEMVGGLAAVVMQDDRLTQELRREDRGNRRQQEGPVRRGKDVDDIAQPELPQTRKIECLIEQRAQVRNTTYPLRPLRKTGVDGDQSQRVAVST